MNAITTQDSTASFTPPLLTLEEFIERYGDARVELVNGIVKEMPWAEWIHGYIAARLAMFFGTFVEVYDLGRVIGNDSFIKIRRNPDSVYGPDLFFVSFNRLPLNGVHRGLLEVVPELIVEVRSPTDAWTDLFAKVHDYIDIGVQAVLVVNPEKQAIAIYRAGMQEEHHGIDDDLTIPDVFPGFSVPVRSIFKGAPSE